MDNKKVTESNRRAWNQALEYHQRARGSELRAGFADHAFTTFARDCDPVLLQKLEAMDLRGKAIAQLPCRNRPDDCWKYNRLFGCFVL